jgi:general secretion pathway protein D
MLMMLRNDWQDAWAKVLILMLVACLASQCGVAIAAGDKGKSGEENSPLPKVRENWEADAPPDQVQIEVLIVETTATTTTDLSANSTYMRMVRDAERPGSVQRAGATTSQTASDDFVTVPTAGVGSTPELRETSGDSTDAIPIFDENGDLGNGAQVLPGLSVGVDVIKGDWGTFYMNLRMLLSEGSAEVISRPIVLVVDGQDAEIHAGAQVPFQTIDYKSLTNLNLLIAWEPVGVNLKVQPTIEGPNRIKLDLKEIKVSSLVRYENIRGIDLPLFQSREQRTVVYIEDGGTLVTGGLISDTMRDSQTKVPILGDIPVLGFFFRGTSKVRQRTDLFIILRSTIIRPGEPVTLRDFEHLDEAVTISESDLTPAP